MLPEEPDEVVPVLKTRDPLTPSVPAFVERMDTSPLDFFELVPDDKDTKPPVAPVAIPPLIFTFPPAPLVAWVPEPALTVTPPPIVEAADVVPAVTVMVPPAP
jgi:hypothetical protein